MSPAPPKSSRASAGGLESFLDALYRRRAAGIKLGLETTRALLQALGDPHQGLPCIHVAGTNGKGSVCAILESVLRAAGLRTGLYISPHLVRFNERFQVAGRPIDDDVLYRLLVDVEACADRLAPPPEGHPPTFFEFTTAAAFRYFAQCGVDIAVIETGLGGRLDSTNVVDPLTAVITNIGIDHIAYLGTDVAQIAREKAGIIKPGRPVVCGTMRDDALAEIRAVARMVHAPLVRADECVSIRRLGVSWEGQRLEIETPGLRYPRLQFPLLGPRQLANLAVALAAIETLSATGALAVGADAVREGLRNVRWPGRGQVLHPGNPLVLLDVAHNADGAAALRALLDDLAPKRPVAVVAGFSADKDPHAFFHELAGRVRVGWTVDFPNPPSRPAADAAEAARLAGIEASPSPLADAVPAAVAWAKEHDGVAVITGSIYLAGDALRAWSELAPYPEGQPGPAA